MKATCRVAPLERMEKMYPPLFDPTATIALPPRRVCRVHDKRTEEMRSQTAHLLYSQQTLNLYANVVFIT